MLPLASIPDFSNLTGLIQVWFAVVVMTLAGRLILRGGGGFGPQLVAGWGALCVVLTLWGVATSISLRYPAIGFTVVALGGLAVRGWRQDWADSWRVLAVAVPLLVVTGDMQPSQIDVFAVMIPNAAYLHDHGVFPSLAGAAAHSDVPVAPYNKEFVSLLGSLAGGGFAANAPSLFAIVLHLAAALLFARAVAAPGWAGAALGLALATLFDPAFAPRVAFSGLGEPHLAITLLCAGWLASESLERMAEGVRWPRALVPLALTLAALVNVKQQGIGLLLSFLGGVTVAAVLDRRAGGWGAVRAFAVAALPAFCLYLSWRGYVLLRFPEGELKPLAPEDWALGNLAEILKGVGGVILAKQYYFGCVAAVLGLTVWRPSWLSERAAAVLRMAAVAAVLYAGFLILTYVVHFKAEHSFFRYNAHLSLLVVLGLLLAGRDYCAGRSLPWLRPAGRVVVIIMLTAPLAGLHLLRYDLDRPQPQLRAAARALAQEVSDGDRVAVILTDDNTMAAIAFDSLLRYAAPRRPLIDISVAQTASSEVLAQAAAAGRRLAFVSCTDGNGLGLAPHAAALLSWREGGWSPVKLWTYPPVPPRRWWNWAGYLASEPFCLR